MKIRIVAIVATIALVMSMTPAAQTPPRVTALRLYVFENGFIRGLDTKLFNLPREEVKEPDFVNSSYLIVHPRGTLQFDSGGIPDGQFKADGAPVTEGVMSATKPLLPQLAAAGYKPGDITYFALSHYHSDHTGNANAFAGSTWITQKAERDFMFGDKPEGIIQPATYSALKGAKTRVLDNEEFDVFGDGTVRLIPTPGHTPGHQVLLVRLPKRGLVLLAGDLYHYPEERTKGTTPTFEFNAEQSKVSRAKVEALLKQTKAELWIEHDMATHAKLPKS
ncbi:MAG TPA: N-acyl homoserine lactonase family protein, partial [Vicinamibacterales bacterium]|nr:N-acyl homoserine lactonase family protein [Vicinamibacterales bacterium]